MRRWVVGVDAGGTQTRSVVMDECHTIVGRSSGAGGNHNAIGRERAASHIQQTVLEAINDAGLRTDQIDAIGMGIAGAPAEREYGWLCMVARAVLPRAALAPSSDVEIALVGALGQREGLLVLAGTGSIVYGVNAHGTGARAGGWGYLLGDDGSGFSIGQAALRKICKAHDGVGAADLLTKMVLKQLELAETSQLISWVYTGDSPQMRIASLAPVVLEAAEKGDDTALTICSQAVHDLALAAQTVAERLEMREGQYSLAGGLLMWESKLAVQLRTEISVRLPGMDAVIPRYDAVTGAALLALEHLQKGEAE